MSRRGQGWWRSDLRRGLLTDCKSLARGQDFASQNYGELPLNQSQERNGRKYSSLDEIKAENDGNEVFFSARIQTSRTPSSECRRGRGGAIMLNVWRWC